MKVLGLKRECGCCGIEQIRRNRMEMQRVSSKWGGDDCNAKVEVMTWEWTELQNILQASDLVCAKERSWIVMNFHQMLSHIWKAFSKVSWK